MLLLFFHFTLSALYLASHEILLCFWSNVLLPHHTEWLCVSFSGQKQRDPARDEAKKRDTACPIQTIWRGLKAVEHVTCGAVLTSARYIALSCSCCDSFIGDEEDVYIQESKVKRKWGWSGTVCTCQVYCVMFVCVFVLRVQHKLTVIFFSKHACCDYMDVHHKVSFTGCLLSSEG